MTRQPAQQESRPWVLLFIAICLVAVNLRATILGVGPLLDEIAADRGANAAALGMLASIPTLTWAVVSPLAHVIAARIGMANAVTGALVALGLATVWRSLPGSPVNLWLGTALIGASIAVGNVLLPAIIKRDFGSRVPLVMSFYSAIVGGAGALGSGIAVPISQIPTADGTLGWRIALLCSGAVVPFALVAWIWATRGASRREETEEVPIDTAPLPISSSPGGRIWRDRLAWLVALYMGSQSATFFMIATWLAPIEISRGHSPLFAGNEVTLLQIFGIVGSALLPLFYRGRLRRFLPMLIPGWIAAATLGIAFAPSLTPLWVCVYGIGAGSSLSMSLLLMAVRARTPETASALSGMSQSVGYLIAAGGPVLFGLLHEVTDAWSVPLMLLVGIAAAQGLIGFLVRRDRYVLD